MEADQQWAFDDIKKYLSLPPVVGAHKTPISCANISSECMK
jgi:hypothetical protein